MHDSFELEKRPDSLIDVFNKQLKWVSDNNNKIYGKMPICSVVIESEEHLSLYVPTKREHNIIEREVKSQLRDILPKHKNRISQMRDSERRMARKYINLPRKYYGYSSGNMVDTIHMSTIKNISVNTDELF